MFSYSSKLSFNPVALTNPLKAFASAITMKVIRSIDCLRLSLHCIKCLLDLVSIIESKIHL